MCDLRGIEDGRLRGWRPDPAVGLDYYDTVNAGARVTCETVITAGLGDYVCPPSGITSLYHAVKGTKTITWLQNKTHPYTAPAYDTYTRSTK
jgi:cephalosporin-C deacetylase-like acetyl esterase